MSIYLDNAATTFPKPEQVYCAVDHALREIGVGPGRGSYRQGLAASRLVFEARETIAGLFGIRDSARVIFTHSATEALNLAVKGLLKPGDHVISTTMEHNSLARPLHLAEQNGVEVTWVAGDQSGVVESRQIAAAIRGNTRLVAITHCSNVTGAILPIGEIGAMTRNAGILLLLDAAQSAGTLPIDVNALNIDLLAAPGHKGLFGPQGTGFLFIAEGVELTPLLAGGTGGFSAASGQPDHNSGTLRKRHAEHTRHCGTESGCGICPGNGHCGDSQERGGACHATPGRGAADSGSCHLFARFRGDARRGALFHLDRS